MTDINFADLDQAERLSVLNTFIHKTEDIALKMWASEGIYHTQGFRTALDSIQYAAECTLATVVDLATKKTIPTSEIKRQVMIGQRLIFDLYQLRSNHYKDYKLQNRVKEVVENHNKAVRSYALARILEAHDQKTHDKFKQKFEE